MAPVAIRWSRRTPVPPDKAREWFFRASAGPASRVAPAATATARPPVRVVVERSEEFIRIEERLEGVPPVEITIKREPPNRLVFEERSPRHVQRATWTFVADGAGTRITADGEVTPRRAGRILFPLRKGEFLARMEAGVRDLLDAMEEEWRTSPW